MQALLSANPLMLLGFLVAFLALLALVFLAVAMLSVFIAGFTDLDTPNEGLFQDDIDLKQ